MAAKKRASQHKKKSTTHRHADSTGKVGSDPRAARNFGGKNDFGVPETGHERDRQYVSLETKVNDPGGMPDRSHADGARTTGAGAPASGTGSSSGGDVDTDLVLIGSVAQSGPDDRTQGADMITGGTDPNSKKHHPPEKLNKRDIVTGSTVDRGGGDASTTGAGQGPGAVTNPARDDDSFAGEINMSEASGIDNSPSDNAHR